MTSRHQRLIQEALHRLDCLPPLFAAVERGIVALSPPTQERGVVLIDLGSVERNLCFAVEALRELLK